MKVIYQDEYFIPLFEHTSDIVPRKGEKVAMGETDYLVRDVVYFPTANTIEVTIAETAERAKKEEDDTSGRLNEMQAAIFAVQRGQEELRKKHRSLREQVSSIRTSANQKAYNERKQ